MRVLIRLFSLKSNVEIFPKLSDMSEFYKSIDSLVLPSLHEAFGLVVLEAMSWGKPCIVSSTAGVSEIINKSNSFIFNRKSFISFFKTLITVIKIYDKNFEKFKEYSQNAWFTSKNYTWENFALNILKNF